MKALSFTQPWASAIMLGIKHVETRSWRPAASSHYPFPLAIHAAKGFPHWARDFADDERAQGRLTGTFPLGAIIGTATVVRVVHTRAIAPALSALELSYGDYSPGRWAWVLTDVVPFPEGATIAWKGALGLWNVPDDVRECT